MKKGKIYMVEDIRKDGSIIFWMLGRMEKDADRRESNDSKKRNIATFISSDEGGCFRKNSLWCYQDSRQRSYREANEWERRHFLECEKNGKFEDLPKTINNYSIF